jgi:hypothetical protein
MLSPAQVEDQTHKPIRWFFFKLDTLQVGACGAVKEDKVQLSKWKVGLSIGQSFVFPM